MSESTTFTWLGDSGTGGNGDWGTVTDWSANGDPGLGDTALFNTGSADVVGTNVNGSETIAQIQIVGDQVTFTGTILQDPAATGDFIDVTDLPDSAGGSTQGQLTIADGALVQGNTDVNLANVGDLLTVNGTLIDGGSTADVAIVDGGDANWTNAGAVTLNGLQVTNGATFAGDINLNNNGYINIDDSATFGGQTLTLGGNGSIYVSDESGTTNGSYTLNEQIVLGAQGTALTLGDDPDVTTTVATNISGAGSLIIGGFGTVSLTGTNSFTGGILVTGGTLILNGPGTAGSSTGPILLNGGALIDQPDSTGAVAPQTIIGTGDGADTVTASTSGLLVFAGSASAFTVVGGSGASSVIGGTGVLTANAGTGGDIIFGGSSGADTITSALGSATLVGGGNGGDLIASGTANNALAAGGGTTSLDASGSSGNILFFGAATGNTNELLGSGTSTVVAGAGDTSYIAGAAGNSLIFGSGGAQDIVLGTGNTTLIGGSGAEAVSAGTGTNEIFAGGGTLELNYVNGSAGGTDLVLGFNTSTDLIDLTGYGTATAQSILSSALVTGGSTYITLADQSVIALFGVTNLTTSNIAITLPN